MDISEVEARPLNLQWRSGCYSGGKLPGPSFRVHLFDFCLFCLELLSSAMGDQSTSDKNDDFWEQDDDDGCYLLSGQGSPLSGFLPSCSLVPEPEGIDWLSGGCGESQPDDIMWIDNSNPSLIAGKFLNDFTCLH